MDFYGDIDLRNNEMQKLVFQLETTKGTSVATGAIAFEGHTLFLSVGVTGGNPIWIPITNGIDTYVHDQTTSSASWIVTHKLGSVDPIVQVYDENNTMIIPDSVVVKSSHELTITFSVALIGRVVVIAGLNESKVLVTTLDLSLSEGTISADKLSLTNVNGSWDSGIGTLSRSTGKYYYEVETVVVGTGDHYGFGITNDPKTQITDNYIGFYSQQIASWFRWGIPARMVIITNNVIQIDTTPTTHTVGNTYGVCWDADTGTLSIQVENGITKIQHTDASKIGLPAWPAVSTKAGNTIKLNFGATSFKMTIPTGYSSWDGNQEG